MNSIIIFSSQSREPSEELGIYFYNEDAFPIEKFDDKRNIKAVPQLVISDYNLKISGKWHCFSAVYKAQGGEKYFLVGNFREKIYDNDNETPWLNRKVKAGKHAGEKLKCCYVTRYYFDDFEVIPINDKIQCSSMLNFKK